MVKRIWILTASLAVYGLAGGQTVSVNKAGTGGAYTSIEAALTSLTPDPNPSVPNVIHITDSEVYEEVFTIATPVTIEATGSSATLAVKANQMGQFENGGIMINLPGSLSTGTVVLRNLKIIPALETTNLRLRTAIENGNNNLFLWLDNVMLAPNAGDNTPLFTQGGLSSRVYETYSNSNGVYDPNIVQFGFHGLVLGDTETGYQEGDGVELLLSDTVITHFRDDLYEPAPKPTCYGIWMKPHLPSMTAPFPTVNRRTRIEGNSVISYCQVGFVGSGDFETGNPNGRVYFRGFSNYILWFSGVAQQNRKLNDLILEGSPGGVYDNGYGTARLDMKHSIVYFVTYRGFRFDNPGNDPGSTGEGTATFENCTLVGGRPGTSGNRMYETIAGNTTNIHIKDTIVAGRLNNPTGDANNLIFLAGNTAFTQEGSAITTAGQFALRQNNPFSRGVNASHPQAGEYLAEDPAFKDSDTVVTDQFKPEYRPISPDFMNVQNPAFAFASSVGGPLGGGALYVGPPSRVQDWTLY